MSTLYKKGEYIALALIALLAVWVITVIAVTVEAGSPSNEIEYIHYIIRMTPIFVASYINATLLTLLAIALFTVLMLMFIRQKRFISILSIFFVALYGVMNLFVYASQFLLLPVLIERFFETSLSPSDISALYNWIHFAPNSSMGLVNALAYALLGIPSVLFALILYNRSRFAKKAAFCLIANAIACFAGAVGYYLGIEFLAIGLVLGGVFFLFAVIYIYLYFSDNVKKT